MNSFQAHFNSLLSIAAAGAKASALSDKKTLGTPQAPTSKTTGSKKKIDMTPFSFDFYTPYSNMTSTASLDPETQKRMEARARSLQNLENRRIALAKAKREKLTQQGIEAGLMPKTATSTIKSHDKLGGML